MSHLFVSLPLSLSTSCSHSCSLCFLILFIILFISSECIARLGHLLYSSHQNPYSSGTNSCCNYIFLGDACTKYISDILTLLRIIYGFFFFVFWLLLPVYIIELHCIMCHRTLIKMYRFIGDLAYEKFQQFWDVETPTKANCFYLSIIFHNMPYKLPTSNISLLSI